MELNAKVLESSSLHSSSLRLFLLLLEVFLRDADELLAIELPELGYRVLLGRGGGPVSVDGEVAGIVGTFGRIFGRDMEERPELKQGEVAGVIPELEDFERIGRAILFKACLLVDLKAGQVPDKVERLANEVVDRLMTLDHAGDVVLNEKSAPT